MILPTLLIEVWRNVGSDTYGQPQMTRQPSEKACPVKLDFKVETTSVRTDAAASKSRAHERNADVVILVSPKSQITLDDKLVIHGNSLRVTSIHPRYTVTGVLDHYQVECAAWT